MTTPKSTLIPAGAAGSSFRAAPTPASSCPACEAVCQWWPLDLSPHPIVSGARDVSQRGWEL